MRIPRIFSILLALLLVALVTIPIVIAENITNRSGAEPVVNENGTMTIEGITLPVVESKAYPFNSSEFDTPLTREQFIAGNQRYIEFLTEYFGKEQAEKRVNDEYDRLTNQTRPPDTQGIPGGNIGTVWVTGVTTPSATQSAPLPAGVVFGSLLCAVFFRRRSAR
ncbi:MAG: hypothetical protein WC295_04475 [Methanoregula sp.]|jgi:hypothetical protein